MFARDQKDTIYDYVSKLSDGFAAYDKPATFKYSTWEQITAVVSGVPSGFGYGPHLGPQPSVRAYIPISLRSLAKLLKSSGPAPPKWYSRQGS
jgi:hypothetical protein